MSNPVPEAAQSPPPLPAALRLLSLLPLPVLYAITGALAFLFHRLLRYKLSLVRKNLAGCFPELKDRDRSRIVNAHYRHFGQLVAEVIRSPRIPEEEFARRMRIVNLDLPREWLALGRPVIFVAAHQANWEWMVHALGTRLGYPLDVGYKPMRGAWGDRALRAIRGASGARLVPAKELLGDVIRRGRIVRGIALVADQSPTTSDRIQRTIFLGRDTAFYTGPEQIARAARYPVLFVALRRVSRGHYAMEFKPLWAPGETLESGEMTTRFAHALEAQIRAAPADWTWGHNRWKPMKAQPKEAPAG